MVSKRVSPANITFEGLPWPVKAPVAVRALGLGGTTSLLLPDGAMLMTAIVRWRDAHDGDSEMGASLAATVPQLKWDKKCHHRLQP